MITVVTDPAAVARLQAGLEHITAHPETWDQEYWNGERVCLARHLVDLAGWRVVNRRWYGVHVAVPQPDGTLAAYSIRGAAEQLVGLWGYAEWDLGRRMTYDELVNDFGGDLWQDDNTLGLLWAYAQALTGGAVTLPESIATGDHPAYCEHHGRELVSA